MSSAREIAKRMVRAATHALGLEVTSLHRFAMDADRDIAQLLAGVDHPIVFDVGANFGQSVTRFRRLLPGCEIYSFEPAPETFRDLQVNTRGMSDVHIVNAGVGSSAGTAVLAENDEAVMTSFLQPDTDAWSTVVRETPVQVTTLDEFCVDRGIDHIDLLKTDTQGFDLEVLKGGANLLQDSRIRLIFMEVIFSELYVGQARFDEEYRLLIDNGLRFMSFYDFERLDGTTPSWCDALFANPAFGT
jgi:FkbM family methyltransferase